jgi:hypothetical protein
VQRTGVTWVLIDWVPFHISERREKSVLMGVTMMMVVGGGGAGYRKQDLLRPQHKSASGEPPMCGRTAQTRHSFSRP